MSALWSRSAPFILDGLAWGVDPARTLSVLAVQPAHAHLRVVVADVGGGLSLAEALERRGAPADLVQAVRVGNALNTPTDTGMRTRTAMRSRTDGRFILLGGLALPLGALVIALGVVLTTRTALEILPTTPPPAWILWGVTVALTVGVLTLLAVGSPVMGRNLGRLPGLRWIGRRRRAARLGDMLAITLQADGDLVASAESLNAPRIAHALRAGEALPDALSRTPAGRLLVPCVNSVGAPRWPGALHDAAQALLSDASERTGAWALGLRIGGTIVAAILIGVWLLWIYGAIAAVPGAMPT